MSINVVALRNDRPKRNQHVVATVHFSAGTEDGDCECRCGAQMLASEFAAHRKEAGLSDPHYLGVPEMLRGSPSVWRHKS